MAWPTWIACPVAKAFGAAVTGVDHTNKLDMRSLIGADHVIDQAAGDTRGKIVINT